MSDDNAIGRAYEASQIRACNCIGPQNGQPRCPCQMRNVVQRDGRWVERERDLGPAIPADVVIKWASGTKHGCVCPPGAERTCQGPLCPRKPIGPAA